MKLVFIPARIQQNRTRLNKRGELSHMQMLRNEYTLARNIPGYRKITNRYPLCF